MITTTDLVKRHGSLEVLRGISLTVGQGQVAVIIGPSGGGKSTFLRCLNGLEPFDAGVVQVGDDRILPGNPPGQNEIVHRVRQRVGKVFQQFNLFPHLSVLGNVTLAPRQVLRLSAEEAEARGVELLNRVGLGDRLHHRPSQLSGGQQQRVAIARALAMKPDAILFDEPTSALDPRMTAEVLAVLADLAKSGQTMIVTTHAMNFARRAAHRVYVFEAGRILESGPPAQIFDSPQQPGTAEFLRESAAA